MASTYFETRSEPGDLLPLALGFHPTDRLLAVASSDGSVSVVNGELERVQGHPVMPAQVGRAVVSVVAWVGGRSSTAPAVVACGHADGTVTCSHRVKGTQVLADPGSVHAGCVRVLAVGPTGTRFVTGDDGGCIAVWSCGEAVGEESGEDGDRGSGHRRRAGGGRDQGAAGHEPRLLHRYKKRGAITHVAFRGAHEFLALTSTGHGFLGDDLGHCTEVLKVGRAALSLSYYPERDSVVIVTDDMVMSRFRFAEAGDAALTREVKVKLSVTPKSRFSYAMVGNGVLATCAGESVIRVWSLSGRDNYILSHDDESFTAVAFNERTRTIATGTASGKVVLWRYLGDDDGSQSTENSWQPVLASAGHAANNNNNSSSSNGGFGGEDGSAVTTGPVLSVAFARDDGAIAVLGASASSASDASGGDATSQPRPAWAAVLSEAGRGAGMKGGVGCWRVAGGEARLVRAGTSEAPLADAVPRTSIPLRTTLPIRGLDSSGTHCVVWSGKKAEVHEVGDVACAIHATFPTRASACSMGTSGGNAPTVFMAVGGGKVEVCNLQGVPKQTLSFPPPDGEPREVDANGSFVCAGTREGVVRVWDVSRREARVHGVGWVDLRERDADAAQMPGTSVEIRSVRVSSDGAFVSILCDTVDVTGRRRPDTRIRVFDADSGNVLVHDFGPHRYPTSHHWDGEEPQLFACETRPVRAGGDADIIDSAGAGEIGGGDAKNDASNGASGASSSTASPTSSASSQLTEIVTLFATTEHGVRLHDSFTAPDAASALIGVHLPHVYVTAGEGTVGFAALTLRDFAILGNERNPAAKRSLAAFSLNLAIGNMDESFKAVRELGKEFAKTKGGEATLWGNMARMCVKTRRLDVAEVCLGYLGNVRAARALREARAQGGSDVLQVGAIAVHLGMRDEAERLYAETGRPDLLNGLCRASGQWERALRIAETKDRVHLRTTHFLYARALEAAGDVPGAVEHYERADCHRAEVPRMLHARGMVSELKGYVFTKPSRFVRSLDKENDKGGKLPHQRVGAAASHGDGLDDGGDDGDAGGESNPARDQGLDPELVRWWARYCESVGDADGALEAYRMCADHMSIVRMQCHVGDFEAAARTAEGCGSAPASFYLARQYEARDEVDLAIKYYSASGRFNHAARLAKESGMDAELLSLALQSGKRDMIAAAVHFESKGEYEKAVLLYQKAGSLSKALGLCFRASLYESLRTLADDLGPDADPELLRRCGQFFTENGQFDKAVSILLVGGQHERALDLALDNGVIITEAMAEKMTPAKQGNPGDKQDPAAAAHRSQVLKRLARTLESQGAHALAAKKFTQAGDKDAAMRCLLRAGDPDRIIFFAEKSRQPSVYIAAANYLSTLAWHTDARILKSLLTFYTKARAYDKLSSFYAQCSTVEIDEFRNYDKALGALREAQKWLDKASQKGSTPELDDRMAQLQSRVLSVERFVQARSAAASGDFETAVTLCREVASDPDAEAALRVGDVLACEFECQLSMGDDEGARVCVERMVQSGIALLPFLEEDAVRALYGRLGEPCPLDQESGNGVGAGSDRGDASDEDDIEDDVVDEADDIGEEIEDLGNGDDGF